MRKLIYHAAGVLWRAFAFATIATAIVISIVRLTLPHIDGQRDEIEKQMSAITGRPVEIGEVHASWSGWTPTINITDLKLLTQDGHSNLVRFDYAVVEISPLRSLKNLNLHPRRLIVGGMQIVLERDLNGQFSVAGMPPSRWPVAQWLSQQQNFTLRDARISFTDRMRDSIPAHFSDVTLAIAEKNSGQHISGRFRRDDRPQEKYAFSLRASGDILSSSWDGDLSVQIQRALAAPTLTLLGWADSGITGGEFDATVYSHWDGAKLRNATLSVDASSLHSSGEGSSTIESLSAHAIAQRVPAGWSVEIERLRFGTDDLTTPATGAVRWQNRAGRPRLLAFRANNVDITELSTLLPLTLALPIITTQSKNEIKARGKLENVLGGLIYDDGKLSNYYFEAAVRDSTIDDSTFTPGVSGFDFRVSANDEGGVVDATQNHSIILHSDRWLVRPIEIQKIAGKIRWARADGGFSLSTKSLDIRAENIDFSTRGELLWAASSGPHVKLTSRINDGEVANFHLLVPKNSLRPRGEDWLRSAFRSGRFKPSTFILHGNLNAFPFDDNNGTFKGNVKFTDVDLNYSSRWPATQGISATIAIDRRRAETVIHKGSIYNSPLAGSTIEMPDLFSRTPMVHVRGTTRVSPNELAQFIDESPLQKTKAQRFSDVEISNDFDMTLDMNLGLAPGAEKEVLGLVHFAGNRIEHAKQRIVLQDVTGDISFTRQDWYGEGLQATFEGDRVGVILNGGLDDPNYDTEFRMTGTSGANQLLKHLKRYSPLVHSWLTMQNTGSSVAGRLPWKAVLTIPEADEHGGIAPQRLSIESSLLGLDVDLPRPFGKPQAERKPLSFTTETTASGERFTRVNYGATVDIEIDQRRNAAGELQVARAEILFGDQKPEFRDVPGFSVRGHIDHLPLNEWIAFGKAAQAMMLKPEEELPAQFEVSVDALETLGQTFRDTRLSGTRNPSAWQVEISGAHTVGNIRLPRESTRLPIVFDFERLWLEKSDAAAKQNTLDPRSLPPFHLTCASLHFGAIDLGQSELVASKSSDGLRLEKISAHQAGFSLQGTGDWKLRSGIHQSGFNLSLRGESLGGVLHSFGYDGANIDGGTTTMGIDTQWAGMPAEFALDKLQGRFSLRVDEGRFLDIKPGGGRLFGLLSIQTLPRRISLDFNDLFKKGFTFDSIEGIFALQNGNAYTNNLFMNGPSARIDISGRTGLADQDYDQHVTVTPALSNTIPVASALFGPAGIGVGAVIYLGQKMFKSIPGRVDKLLSREYSITGNWKQPVIERI